MKASSLFSWILRGRGGEPDPSSSLSTTHRKGRIHGLEGKKEAEGNGDEELGVTEELLEFLKGFTVEVFKQFPISDRQGRYLCFYKFMYLRYLIHLSNWGQMMGTGWNLLTLM